MAILAMCFDLMQEEIVAKFKWIGTKMGLVEKPLDANDPTQKIPDTKNKSHSPIHEYNSQATKTDNSLDPSTKRYPSATRKSSPSNNIARIHPANEITLHQRVPSNKSY